MASHIVGRKYQGDAEVSRWSTFATGAAIKDGRRFCLIL
jgi:hypothetical protein